MMEKLLMSAGPAAISGLAPQGMMPRAAGHFFFSALWCRQASGWYCFRYSPTERLISRAKSELYFRLQKAAIHSS